MSINSAMLAGVSGLVANSSALAAISDNIANVNTIAYKRNQVNFGDVVTAQSVQGLYSAGGVQGIPHAYISQQGLIQTAASPTDLAISGDGFFVATQKPTGLSPADAREFTRAGQFNVDASGFLVNDAGLYLQGWPAKSDGTFAIDPSDLSKLSSINVKNLGTAVQPTGNVGISANLDATETVSPSEATYTGAAGNSMADFAAGVAGGTQPDFTMDLNVVDSLGASHKIEIGFLKSSAAPNTWHAEIYAIPASDVDTAGPSGQIAIGDGAFNSDGSIDLADTTLFGAAGNPPVIDLAASGGAQPAWAANLGIAAQTVNLDLTNVTQQAEASTVNSVSNDGAGVGNIVGVQVDEHGVVSAIFDNSQIRKIAKVAIATFPDADGLKSVSGNAYQATLTAGPMVLKEPGNGGAGAIAPSSLEASTVDLSAEFTGLITTQRAYSASSKIITTADEMLQELIDMKR